jgi:uroporphyrin-III C-methyltransferase/precorrin-2 dehydrogenase/sirohydrochlorin ferrochelatase
MDVTFMRTFVADAKASRLPADLRPAQMQPLARLPLFFAVQGKRVVIAGDTPAAAWKAEVMSAGGAAVDVYAQEPCEELRDLARTPPDGNIVIHLRGWMPEDLAGASLAIGGFDHDDDARRFVDAARATGVPVNVIDKPAFCDFSFGAIVNRSPLVIGISTDGAAPVFAQAIRAKIEGLLPAGLARWAQAAARWRDAVKSSGLSFGGRRKVWQLFTANAMTQPNRAPQEGDLIDLIDRVRGIGPAADAGTVTLVGAGPGDPELLTLRAVRALQSADVILFDDLVSQEVLDFARREARKILVGKTGHGPACKQSDINALMVKLAREGRRVLRLKGGDPLVFARATEEIDACHAAGVPVTIVPGITAAQGAASELGVPLTGRGRTRRVQYVTAHAKDGCLPDLDWRSLADPTATTAIYMPRGNIAALVEKIIVAGLAPDTPAAAVVNATRDSRKSIVTTVRELPSAVASFCSEGPLLVLIGEIVNVEQASDRMAVTRRKPAS